MLSQKFLYINCDHAGISGDMFLSALTDIIGPEEISEFLQKAIKVLDPSNLSSVQLLKSSSNGISGYQFELHSHNEKESGNHHIELLHDHSDHHESYNLHKFNQDLEKVILLHPFCNEAKELIMFIKTELFTVEAEVHNISLENVHLHEIGSLDTIMDIIGTVYCLERLDVFNKISPTMIFLSSLSVGGGIVHFSHGTVSVPAPATQKLLEKFKISYKYGPFDLELATPTGVAILAALINFNYAVQKRPDFMITARKTGRGIGQKQLQNYSNILSILYGQFHETFVENLSDEPITVLETNIDDVRGEIIGNLIPILIENHALDVSVIACTTKKNRPGYIIKIITQPNRIDELISILLRETGTLGIRIHHENRKCLLKEIITQEIIIRNMSFLIHIKRAFNKIGQVFREKVEFEDLKIIANTLGMSIQEVEKIIECKLYNLNESQLKEN